MAACEPEVWTSLRLWEGSEGKADGGDDVSIPGSGLSLPAGAPAPLLPLLLLSLLSLREVGSHIQGS